MRGFLAPQDRASVGGASRRALAATAPPSAGVAVRARIPPAAVRVAHPQLARRPGGEYHPIVASQYPLLALAQEDVTRPTRFGEPEDTAAQVDAPAERTLEDEGAALGQEHLGIRRQACEDFRIGIQVIHACLRASGRCTHSIKALCSRQTLFRHATHARSA